MINKKFQCLLLIVTLVFVGKTGIAIAKGEKAPLLIQDSKVLKDSNGKIVKQKQIRFKSKFSSRVDCYKIQYLSDGLKVVGYILKPKIESSKFPVMIYNRGGNRDYGKITKENLPYLSYLAFNNYVVLASQYRGNDGAWRGQDEFGGKDVNDIMNLIPLGKSLPFADPNKIVMLGASRGGMMTYLAIKRGAEIKAAAVVGGVTDLFMSADDREDMKKVIRELVGMDKKEWQKRSAVYWPEKIDVPILILHGEDDWRVKVSQAKKLSEKLKEVGKEHELVIFPGGDHGLNTHRFKRNQKIFDWFERYLN